jgi:hypothetical protein
MAVTRSQNILMIEVATQIPVLLGCLLLVGGWALARVFAFPLAFLIFSVPPPGWIMDALTVSLKARISDIVSNFLYALDYPVAQNGVMIMIGPYELMVGHRVAPSCWNERRLPNGLKETPMPFKERHLDDFAFAGVEFKTRCLDFCRARLVKCSCPN